MLGELMAQTGKPQTFSDVIEASRQNRKRGKMGGEPSAKSYKSDSRVRYPGGDLNSRQLGSELAILDVSATKRH